MPNFTFLPLLRERYRILATAALTANLIALKGGKNDDKHRQRLWYRRQSHICRRPCATSDRNGKETHSSPSEPAASSTA